MFGLVATLLLFSIQLVTYLGIHFYLGLHQFFLELEQHRQSRQVCPQTYQCRYIWNEGDYYCLHQETI